MSRVSKVVKEERKVREMKPHVNFMGGVSYGMNPYDTLRMVASSSIFGEPQYYRKGMEKVYDRNKLVDTVFDFDSKTTSDIFKEAIQSSLNYDFEKTIRLAAELRTTYMMRLNPQIIMVMASTHPKRKEFDESHPGEFRKINSVVMSRADEPAAQFSAYLYLNGGKSGIPSILKRSWKEKIESLNAYQVSKYKNAEAGMINTIRVCHAKGELVGELMKTGTVKTNETEKTWENLRSEGKSFKEIFNSVNMPHMALLRNLRNIFKEMDSDDRKFAEKVVDKLKKGVLKGKQFPFRYYTAYQMIQKENDISFRNMVLDTLEQCIEISLSNMPKLKGRTMCLSDNSGSAWGAFPSEYGKVCIAEIDNLSSVIAGRLSDEGEIGLFGDKIEVHKVSRKKSVLEQTNELSKGAMDRVGGSTENGIWLFFKDAIENKKFYDNIVIFSDQQAGHGGLYGEGKDYLIDGVDFTAEKWLFQSYVDVMKLLKEYRRKVNPKVNFFTVQTAGYTDAVIPEYIYRGAVLSGWTGKEVVFMDDIIRQWDEIDNRSNQK